MTTFESLPFFRGVSKRYPTDRASIHSPRTDRRPRNSPQWFHDAADDWFQEKFGVRYRSRGLLVTSRFISAATYAATPDYVMRIVPLTPYRFCWSRKVSDLLFVVNELPETTSVRTYLESLEYAESDLGSAHELGHEVMLYCDRYIAIPANLLDVVNERRSAIILPA